MRFDFGHEFFQPGGQLGGHERVTVLNVAGQIFLSCGQFPHQSHEVFLDRQQVVANEIVFRRRAGQAERGVQLVNTSVGFDTRMALGDAPVEHQAGGAQIAGLGDNAHARKSETQPAKRKA